MSQSPFVLTPEARQDLLDIWDYIAQDSVLSADRVLARLYKSFRRLAQAPGIGHCRKDLAGPRCRFWTVYSFVIAYHWEATPLQILAIVHGARQLDAFFHHRVRSEKTDE